MREDNAPAGSSMAPLVREALQAQGMHAADPEDASSLDPDFVDARGSRVLALAAELDAVTCDLADVVPAARLRRMDPDNQLEVLFTGAAAMCVLLAQLDSQVEQGQALRDSVAARLAGLHDSRSREGTDLLRSADAHVAIIRQAREREAARWEQRMAQCAKAVAARQDELARARRSQEDRRTLQEVEQAAEQLRALTVDVDRIVRQHRLS